MESSELKSEFNQIKAEIESITFHAEDSGWTVLKARNCSNNSSFTATGSFASIYPGETYELFGEWRKHQNFGKQFSITRATALRPTTRSGIVRYLSSGLFKGIGEKTAQKIVDIFGTQTLNIFEHQISRLSEVPSLGDKKVKMIIESWHEHQAASHIMMFLNQHEISNTFAHRIIKMYGDKAIELITTDPYRLAVDIHGIGFISADKIAQSMGIAPNSPQRIRAAVLYQLQQAEENGHCFLNHKQLVQTLIETLKIRIEDFRDILPECLDMLESMNIVISEPYKMEDGSSAKAYYRTELYIAEQNIVNTTKKLFYTKESGIDTTTVEFNQRVESWIKKYCETSKITLSSKQLTAIKEAANNKMFILTGGPGVGKTTTANAIIRLLKAMGKNIALAAPTGRAAQRINEVSSFEAKTIHRLLEWNPSLKKFTRDEDNPLPADVIIVDESSMLDVRLADSLLRAIRKSAKLILIGDVDQLPSVGPGNVLRDLIESNFVSCVKLDQIFRQASTSKIINTAHAINNGVDPEFTNDLNSDCRFINANSPEEIKKIIQDLVYNQLKNVGWNPMKDIQILTPMNKGNLGTNELNEDLQTHLNPSNSQNNDYTRKNFTLRKLDKVIQVVNNYDLGVFNGDIGFIEHTNVDGAKVIVNYNGKLVHYDSEQVNELKLAYAITIHKSQGSEFPVVIIPMSMQHYIMLERNLIYTGLTRAKKLAIFVGSTKALSYAIKNQVSHTRQTQLKIKLQREI